MYHSMHFEKLERDTWRAIQGLRYCDDLETTNLPLLRSTAALEAYQSWTQCIDWGHTKGHGKWLILLLRVHYRCRILAMDLNQPKYWKQVLSYAYCRRMESNTSFPNTHRFTLRTLTHFKSCCYITWPETIALPRLSLIATTTGALGIWIWITIDCYLISPETA